MGDKSHDPSVTTQSKMGEYIPSSSSPDLKAIISQLTVEEKVSLLSGADLWATVPIPRLNVPALKVSDGPNGARGGKFEGGVTSACFPAGVSLAATWNTPLAARIGKGLAEETKTKGAHVLLGPTVCPHRHPTGGRNFESFSEDPLLAGEVATQYIRGLQQEGVGATIKHFAANEQETRRFTINANVSDRALREIYLKPFEIAIKKANPWALMSSYNLVNGTHADASKTLLKDILRDQWGYEGLVMSDWGGTNSVADSLNAGLDLEMPGPGLQRTEAKVKFALGQNELTEETLNSRVEAVLNLLVKTGKFDDPTIAEEQAVDLPKHRELIRQAGAEGIVLLKNENSVLPLKQDKLKSIAMLGFAKEFLGHGGGSAAVNAHRKITAFDAFQEALQGKVELKYAEGARTIRNLPAFQDNVVDEDGNPGFTQRTYTTVDKSSPPKVSNTREARYKAVEDMSVNSVSLTGTFKPRASGSHCLSLSTVGNTTIHINGDSVFEGTGSSDCLAFLLNVATEEKTQYHFEAGKEYKIQIDAQSGKDAVSGLPLFAENMVGFNFGFMEEKMFHADLLTEATEVAKTSDVALVFVGHLPTWETEGTDRTSMDLPKDGSLDKLIAATAAVNPNTIVINSTGSPITMPWLSDVAAVVQAWFPGQEAGHSIADVVLGKVNPGGKLPVTFPKSIEDAPAYATFPGNLDTLQSNYDEGIYIGYRHYDRKPESVMFPFGFGLSYTSFNVSNIAISEKTLEPQGKVTVTVEVTNTGSVAGSEVVQVYVGLDENSSSIDRPEKVLAGFGKVNLQPGEKSTVSVDIVNENISYWSEDKNKWVIEAGDYKVSVGTSTAHIHGTAQFSVAKTSEIDASSTYQASAVSS